MNTQYVLCENLQVICALSSCLLVPSLSLHLIVSIPVLEYLNNVQSQLRDGHISG